MIRPEIGEDGGWSFFNGHLKGYFISTGEHKYSYRQVYKANSPYSGAGRNSILTPALHYHLYQPETYTVNGGRMLYEIEGRRGVLEKGETFTFPPNTPHTFWSDESTGEDMDITTSIEGGPNVGFDEGFDHNFFGYWSSQVAQGKPLSPFQMLLFLYTADVVDASIPLGLGRAANFVLGLLVGKYLLGYEERYKAFDTKAD
ncbi:hypothetical protein BCR39DRAFT_497647 [Naematelia encephala]|uniref:Cupin type-2 domain-containing protein n=1 Tax=Naematelia encephala TaxID=71784 RepID=A0A1Y2AXE0_9TREE|nr:hypothetical protein BCR39DRAFT_497647 [Naematelia encephala]